MRFSRAQGKPLIGPIFQGRSILVVEDEALIALDVAEEFEKRGARVKVANSQRQAVQLVEADGLSAAILDHGLKDGDSLALCKRLQERGIPFVIYSGYRDIDVESACLTAPFIEKPASMEVLVATVEALLKGR